MTNPIHVAAGKRSKRKGKEFEQEIVRLLRKGGIKAERNWHQAGEFSKRKGAKPNLPDITIAGSDLWLELSTGANVDFFKKLNQADRDIAQLDPVDRPGYIPVVITRKKSAKKIVVTMWLEDLADLVALKGEAVINLPVSLRFEDFASLVRWHLLPEKP